MCQAFEARQGGGGVPYEGTRTFPSSTGWFGIGDLDNDKPPQHEMSSKQKQKLTLKQNKCFKYLVENHFTDEFAEKVVRCFNLSTPEELRYLTDSQIQKKLKFDQKAKTRLRHLCQEITADDDLFQNLLDEFEVDPETEEQRHKMSLGQKQKKQMDFELTPLQNNKCYIYLIDKNFEVEFAAAVVNTFHLLTSKSLRHLSDTQIEAHMKSDEEKTKLKHLCHEKRKKDKLFQELEKMFVPFCMLRQYNRYQSFVEEFEIQTIDDFENLNIKQVDQSKILSRYQRRLVKETLSFPLVKHLIEKLKFKIDEAGEFTYELELQTYDDLKKLTDTSIDNAKSLNLSQKENLKKYLHPT